MRKIGLIGGMGWRSTLRYYEIINTEVSARLGGSHSAPIIIDSHDFHPIANAKCSADYRAVQSLLVKSAIRLEGAGAACVAMACNTVHRLADQVAAAIEIPLLHIADPVRDTLVRDGHTRVGMLGTQATMQGKFYQSRMGDSIELVVPDEDTQRAVNEVAQSLNQGADAGAHWEIMNGALAALQADNCSAMILACTEFGLVLGQASQELRLYDSGALHALALAEYALSTNVVP